MATLFYEVYEAAAEVGLGHPVDEGQIAIGSTSTQSAAIPTTGEGTKRVALLPDAECIVKIGADPTANPTTGGGYIPQNMLVYKYIEAGNKIAVIQK